MTALHSPGGRLFAETMLLPGGWARDVAITVDERGRITRVESGTERQPHDEIAAGPVVPALANVHSHAFQRAMAGLAEIAGPGEDTFWTWRQEMYRCVATMTPDDVEAVAAKLYVELLKGGFGRVAEFHYLHHTADGTPYAAPAETSLRILAAAQATGIGLTMLPTFYAHSTFGRLAPEPRQRPFIHTPESFLTLLQQLEPICRDSGASFGYAIHSLRAATLEETNLLLTNGPQDGPIHIHLGEQEREVEDCLAWSGQRPIEWALDHLPIGPRWCAIHATHMTPEETAAFARTGAVAGLCPTTEANLGDGIFPATTYRDADGRWGIGTDSHVGTSVAGELRQLECSQRLRDRKRNLLAAAPGASVGRSLFQAALAGGTQATAAGPAGIVQGARADLLVFDRSDPFVEDARGDELLDRWIFASATTMIRDVAVSGRWIIREGRHSNEQAINIAFCKALARLRNS